MSRNITIGKHGLETLGALYRFGALTQPQMCRITGLHLSNVKRQIRHLTRAGYVAYALDAARWKLSDGPARRGYYLTLPTGAKAGADALGIENDYLALRHYRRVGGPSKVSHRLLGNEYLILASEAGARETHSESCPDFPLFGSGVPKSDKADSPYRYARIVPDGTFVLSGVRYLLEVETGTHARKELVSKLSDYAGRWRRMLKPNPGERKYHDPHARPEPVVIITPDSEHKPMRDYLRQHLPNAPDWAEADALIKGVSGGRAEAGRLVIVAGINEVRGAVKDDDQGDEEAVAEARKRPLSRAYRPLYRYPKEHSDPAPAWAGGQTGWGVSLADAAEISSRVPVPAKPPEPKLEKKKPSEENPLEGEEEVA